MKSILRELGLFVSGIQLISADLFNPWNVLPPRSDWRDIAKSFNSTDEVYDYVTVYIAPFYQLQMAARDLNLTADSIKSSMLGMIELVQRSVESFNLTQSLFERRQKDEYQSSLEAAAGVMEGAGSKSLEPVFSSLVMRNFVFQILNDMLIASKSFQKFQNRKKQYIDYCKSALGQMQEYKSKRFKYLMPRNLDLVEVRDYSVRNIEKYIGKTPRKSDMEKLEKKLHTLGNGGNGKGTPPILSSIIATIIMMTISSLLL